MIILGFDLSTTCTGVAVMRLESNSLVSVSTLAIIPNKLSPEVLGFLKTKKNFETRGVKYVSFVLHKLERVSMTIKKKRDAQYRKAAKEARLKEMSDNIIEVIDKNKPDLVVYEKNMIFGGILTTEQLAILAGTLRGIVKAKGIKLLELNVNNVRSHYDIVSMIHNYAKGKDPEDLKKIPDITKEVLKEYVCEKYSLAKSITTDESDALVLLDYWRETNEPIK